jgi:uncharacterized protein (TIGR03663 family)
MDNRQFYALFAIVLLAGIFLRFYDLANRPIHHDEGVIGWFKQRILEACLEPDFSNFDLGAYAAACGQSYFYHPDYHGPFEYLFGAWAFRLFGMSDFTLRAPECLFNAATIALLLPLRRRLGDLGTLLAGGLLAVSPSMVYYAQRAYMDNFFIFFALAFVVCALAYWDGREKKWFYAGTACMAFLFTIKETAFIFLFTCASFAALEWLYGTRFWKGKGGLGSLPSALGRGASGLLSFSRANLPMLANALALFILVYAFVFSTMLTDFSDVANGVSNGLTFWLQRSTSWEGHFKPAGYYFWLLSVYEQPTLFMFAAGALGAAYAAAKGLGLFEGREALARWLLYWSLATMAIFMYIPYKTPWLDVHFIIPMALFAGISFDEAMKRLPGAFVKSALAFLAIALLLASAFQAWQVTYVDYAKDGGLVYVSSVDSYKALVSRIENESARFQGTDTPIAVVSTDYWPLPWSLRDYKRAAWYGQSLPGQDAPIIVSSASDISRSEIREDLRTEYAGPFTYEIRPGATVYLYVRR